MRTGDKMNVQVTYSDKSLFSALCPFSSIELFVDNKSVGKQSRSLGGNGEKMFTIDSTGLSKGAHSLLAKGYRGLFKHTIVSEKIQFTLESASLPEPGCGLNNSLVYFNGHHEVSSVMKGEVNITWLPALVYSIPEDSFIWCGPTTYDVFIKQGEFDYGNYTSEQLWDLASQPSQNLRRLESTAMGMVVDKLEPGASYIILVAARTATGHVSYNRKAASVTVATTSPKFKSSFTRMITMPEPTREFSMQQDVIGRVITFASNGSTPLPSEVSGLQQLDFVYLVDSDGNATMVQVLQQVNLTLASVSVWKYQPADLRNVFDELDVSAVMTTMNLDENEGDEGDMDEAEFQTAWAAMHVNVRRDFCAIAVPGSNAADCAPELSGRRLGWLKRKIKKAWKKLKKEAKKVGEFVIDVAVKTGKAFAKAAEFIILQGFPLTQTVTAADIDESVRFESPSSGLSVGLQFDLHASAEVKIFISYAIFVPLKAWVKLKGGFGIQGYASLTKSLSQLSRATPHLLFTNNFRNKLWVGFPIVLTSRPTIYTLMEAASAVEGQAVLPAEYGYDYAFEASLECDIAQDCGQYSTVWHDSQGYQKRPVVSQLRWKNLWREYSLDDCLEPERPQLRDIDSAQICQYFRFPILCDTEWS
jgi:hypothetical protein